MASNPYGRRVVVTGLGAVTPIGNNVADFWANLIAGQCGVDKITLFDAAAFDTQIAAEVRGFDPAPAFPSPKEIRRTDRYSQFGIYAGHQALLIEDECICIALQRAGGKVLGHAFVDNDDGRTDTDFPA